jgi:hypothetical protein
MVPPGLWGALAVLGLCLVRGREEAGWLAVSWTRTVLRGDEHGFCEQRLRLERIAHLMKV